MCGIAGSTDLEKAYNLYRLNLSRGSYSSGLMALDTKTGSFFIYKQKNPFEDKDKDSLLWKTDKSCKDFNYFLFHSRAPTNSTETEWSVKTTHPFNHEKYYVAHNGIITNFKSLPDNSNFDVDSSIIPFHLSLNNDIKETYSKYEGLLTSWIVNEKELHLVKAGSSLWMTNDSFSSSYFKGASQVNEDGIIFKFKNNNFIKTDSFEYTNPYFI
jgi:predicted glutamine amidotransferase